MVPSCHFPGTSAGASLTLRPWAPAGPPPAAQWSLEQPLQRRPQLLRFDLWAPRPDTRPAKGRPLHCICVRNPAEPWVSIHRGMGSKPTSGAPSGGGQGSWTPPDPQGPRCLSGSCWRPRPAGDGDRDRDAVRVVSWACSHRVAVGTRPRPVTCTPQVVCQAEAGAGLGSHVHLGLGTCLRPGALGPAALSLPGTPVTAPGETPLQASLPPAPARPRVTSQAETEAPFWRVAPGASREAGVGAVVEKAWSCAWDAGRDLGMSRRGCYKW